MRMYGSRFGPWNICVLSYLELLCLEVGDMKVSGVYKVHHAEAADCVLFFSFVSGGQTLMRISIV